MNSEAPGLEPAQAGRDPVWEPKRKIAPDALRLYKYYKSDEFRANLEAALPLPPGYPDGPLDMEIGVTGQQMRRTTLSQFATEMYSDVHRMDVGTWVVRGVADHGARWFGSPLRIDFDFSVTEPVFADDGMTPVLDASGKPLKRERNLINEVWGERVPAIVDACERLFPGWCEYYYSGGRSLHIWVHDPQIAFVRHVDGRRALVRPLAAMPFFDEGPIKMEHLLRAPYSINVRTADVSAGPAPTPPPLLVCPLHPGELSALQVGAQPPRLAAFGPDGLQVRQTPPSEQYRCARRR